MVVEASGLSDGQARRVGRLAELALRELSGFSVKESSPFKRGSPRRRCEDDGCLQALGRETGADHALLLSLRLSGVALTIDAWLVDSSGRGKPQHQRREEVSLADSEEALRSQVQASLPAFGRKGWGGLVLQPEAGAQVRQLKIDGRSHAFVAGEPLALPSSVHTIDVLFDSGQAVMQRTFVPEGERVVLEPAPSAAVFERSAALEQGGERRRLLSYGLWSAGALAVAGSLLVGAASRSAASTLSTCQGENRDCAVYSEALQQHQQASAYALSGNILLGAGVALSAAGAGLFTFDLLEQREQSAGDTP